jgi:hypothetical protein
MGSVGGCYNHPSNNIKGCHYGCNFQYNNRFFRGSFEGYLSVITGM